MQSCRTDMDLVQTDHAKLLPSVNSGCMNKWLRNVYNLPARCHLFSALISSWHTYSRTVIDRYR